MQYLLVWLEHIVGFDIILYTVYCIQYTGIHLHSIYIYTVSEYLVNCK